MVKLEDTPGLEPGEAVPRVGSNPTGGIMSNIKYYNRPIDTAIIRLQDILDRMREQERFSDAHSRIIWHELNTIKSILIQEQGLQREEETIGLAIID